MKEKVLVTGASGYIGKHLVKELLNSGFDVVASDIKDTGIDKRAIIVIGDIFDEKIDVNKQFGYPDILIHLAWKDGFNHGSIYHLQYINEHFNFIKKLCDGGIKKISVLGSMHEIGYYEGMISEDTPARPRSYYGIAKNSLRQALEIYLDKTDVSFLWLRAYYLVGDDLNNHSIFSKLLLANERADKTFPFTSGRNKYDFLSVDVLVKQITMAISQDEILGVIECCSGIPKSLAEQTVDFIKDNNLGIKLEYGAFPDRIYDSPIVYGDNKKIKQIMDLVKA